MLLEDYREKFRKEEIPFWYSALIQKIFITGMFASSLMYILLGSFGRSYSIIMIVLVFLYHHAFIYFFHRYALHKPRRHLHWLYKMHTQHHSFYLHDAMKPQKTNDEYMLLMPYHAVGGYLLLSLPGLLVLFLICGLSHLFWISAFIATALYYGAYEFTHYVSHQESNSWWARFKFVRFMQNYHRIHHDPDHKNHKHFDILFPLTDNYMGTHTKSSSHGVDRGDTV